MRCGACAGAVTVVLTDGAAPSESVPEWLSEHDLSGYIEPLEKAGLTSSMSELVRLSHEDLAKGNC